MPDCCGGVLLAWQIAAAEAAGSGFGHIEQEHVLIGLCKMDQAIAPDQEELLEKYFGDVHHLYIERDEVKQWLSEKGIDRVKLRRSVRDILGPGGKNAGQPTADMHRSPACKRMFDRAGDLAVAEGDVNLHSRHILKVLAQRPTHTIHKAFASQGLNLPKPSDAAEEAEVTATRPGQGPPPVPEPQPRTFLGRFGTDLTKLAREGKLEPLIGRRHELVQVARTLSRRSKNNPILLGDPGVGKTALVRGLAQRVADGKVPGSLKSIRLVELNMASLVAGTKYRGEFEERLTRVIQESKADPNLVLFLDEIHTIVGAGAAEGAMDAANILKPALSHGDIRCIGSTTVSEYRKHFERDAALARRFQPITVAEPTTDEVVGILQGLRQKYERHHEVTITDAAISVITELSSRYLPDRFFPDKALDVLDEACTLAKFGSVSAFSAHSPDGPVVVTEQVVQRVVADMAKVPIGQLAEDLQHRLEHLEEDLRERIMGQDHAINRVSNVIKLATTGLRDKRKPMGVFLFIGPTGVGKTELAKALAELIFGVSSAMIRLDMSEYKEKHSVAKLIGAPPGYIGYDEEGQLTGRLRSKPHSLVLFDEIEKGHPDVFDLLLQLFDEGRLTDSKGRTIDARHCLFVMTSNAVTQAQNRQHKPIGFAARPASAGGDGRTEDNERSLALETLRSVFRPEFLNRIDEVLLFHNLGRETLRSIACKILDELVARVEERGISVEIGDEVTDFICDNISKQDQGARPMGRLIDNLVGVPLGNLFIAHTLSAGDSVGVGVRDGEVSFSVRRGAGHRV